MKKNWMVAVAASFAMLAAPTAIGQTTLSPDASLVGDSTGEPGAFADAFGSAFDTWGDWVAVGASRERFDRDGFDVDDGAVYLYRRDGSGGFALEQKLIGPGTSNIDPMTSLIGDRFGGGLAMESGWLFVGSANGQDFSDDLVDENAGIVTPGTEFQFAGQVLVYKLGKRTGEWEFVQTLSAPAPKSSGSFGTRSQASHIALRSDAKIAVIGELNNFADGLGEAHVFKRKGNRWDLVQTITAPEDFDSFGDDVVFLEGVSNGSSKGKRKGNAKGRNFVLISGIIRNEDETEAQGAVGVFRERGASTFDEVAVQSLLGPVTTTEFCGGSQGFGTSGMDVSGSTLAIADPCFVGALGDPLQPTGSVTVFETQQGDAPLAESAFIELDEIGLFAGANFFGSRFAIALNSTGNGLLVGTPQAPFTGPTVVTAGDDVRYLARDENGDWSIEAFLTSDVSEFAIARAFGQSVYFADDGTALARTNNFVDPFVGLTQSNLAIFSVPVAE